LLKAKESRSKDPIIVGLYGGNKKPTCLSEYLKEFVTEMCHLQTNGIILGDEVFQVSIKCFVCDAPARAFQKNIKPYNGYSGCERCVQRGTWMGRIIYPVTDAGLRTDTQFSSMSDEDHHVGPSPLISLNFGMVSCFTLDYMHLVCLGVMRRLILAWMRGPLISRLFNTMYFREACRSALTHTFRVCKKTKSTSRSRQMESD